MTRTRAAAASTPRPPRPPAASRLRLQPSSSRRRGAGARQERSHRARGEEEPPGEGQRPREEQNAQPQRRPGCFEKRAACLSRRHEADQNRDSALRSQLHLGAFRDHPDRRPAAEQAQRPCAAAPRTKLHDGRCAQPRRWLLLLAIRRILLVIIPVLLQFRPGQPRSHGRFWILADRCSLQLPQVRAWHLLMWLKRSHVCIESAEACSVKSEDFAVTFSNRTKSTTLGIHCLP